MRTWGPGKTKLNGNAAAVWNCGSCCCCCSWEICIWISFDWYPHLASLEHLACLVRLMFWPLALGSWQVDAYCNWPTGTQLTAAAESKVASQVRAEETEFFWPVNLSKCVALFSSPLSHYAIPIAYTDSFMKRLINFHVYFSVSLQVYL